MRRAGLLVLLLGTAARADGLVRMCQSDDQIGPGSFSAEIQGGGTIRFDCGTAPATIRITQTHEIAASTVIEGANRITLDAGGRSLRMFSVARNPGVVLELSHLTLKGGGPPPVSPLSNCPGGSILHVMSNGAEVRMTNVTVASSVDAIQLCRDARFAITGSGFFDNRGTALSLSQQATGRIEEATFIGNERAISAGGAPLALYKTLFQGNTRCALDVPLPANIEIHHGQFLKNGGPSGAAIRLSGRAGSVLVRSTSFADNHADAGGAISIEAFQSRLDPRIVAGLAPTRLRLVNTTFSGNQALSGAALSADMRDGGSVEIVRGLFTGNVAQDRGGAIAVAYGGVSLAGSILRNNRAGDGAAISSQWPRERPITVANTLIAGNTAQAGGGALSGATFTLIHSTVARNAAVGVRAAPGGRVPAARLWNSIVAENQPLNCLGTPAQFSVQGRSLQFPGSGCPGTSEADPLLDDLFAPMPGSPAIAASEDKACFAPPIDGRDLYFQLRPNAGKCTLGAVEYFPERVVARLLRERPRDEGEPRPQTPGGLGTALGRGPRAAAMEAKQAVLDALAAGERAGPRRLRVELSSNGRAFQQTLEIAPPDRAHVVVRMSGGDTEEAYFIGDSVYTQVNGAWHAAPRASIPFDGLSWTAKLFGDALTGVRAPVEAARGGRAVQVYGADMRWTLHGQAASGAGEIVIDRDARRPLAITFEGACGGAACKLTETFEYDASITVRPPL